MHVFFRPRRETTVFDQFCLRERLKTSTHAVMLFVFKSFKPLDHGGGVFPLVEFGCSRDFVVDSVEGYLADFAYFGFSRVD